MSKNLSHCRRGSFQRTAVTLALAAFSFAGCQVIGGGPSDQGFPGEREIGTQEGDVYQGSIFLEGGEISAALEIVRAGGRRIRGALQTTTGLLADGEGQLRGNTLSLVLSYGGDCPGRMSLEGEWDQEEGWYEGTVEATDCTGQGRGSFRFSAS